MLKNVRNLKEHYSLQNREHTHTHTQEKKVQLKKKKRILSAVRSNE